jgi:hypothetical protein
MSRASDITAELEPGLEPAELTTLIAVADRLDRERPVPRPAFRGATGRYLIAEAEPGRPDRPRRLRLLVAGYASSGAALLALAVIGLAGGGPLAS